MTVIVRGNLAYYEGTFAHADHPGVHPDSAMLVIAFPLSTKTGSTTIELTKGQDNVWRGSWDTTEAQRGGIVYYWARCFGAYSVSTEGSFELAANPANRGDPQPPA